VQTKIQYPVPAVPSFLKGDEGRFYHVEQPALRMPGGNLSPIVARK
jgi:hypothetical protein